MKKNITLFVIIVLLFFGFIIFNQTVGNKEFEGISESEVLSIAKNEQISVLNNENISRNNSTITVISYESDDEIGTIEATKKDNKVDYSKVLSIPINENKKIEVIGTQSLGYLIITFYNKDLLKETKKVKVNYNNEVISRDVNTKKRSVIISIPDHVLKDGKVYQPNIEFYNVDSKVVYEYPSNESSTLNNIDYYDYYYSKKTINLLKEKNENIKISENLATLNDNPGMYDLWLYVMSVNIKDDDKIINYLEELYSGRGFYYSNSKEIDDSKQKKNQNLYLLDTKMALDIYKQIGGEVPGKSNVINYLKGTVLDLNAQSNLDFVSKGSYVYLISQISEMIDRKNPSKIIELMYLEDLTTLYSKTPSSLDKYYTAINLLTICPELDIKLDEEEIYSYIKKAQLENGFFNISGYSQGYDTLATYIAVDILRVMQKEIPRKSKLMDGLKKITNVIN